MGLTVTTKCLSEHMTALKDFYYQLVTISLRLIAEVLTLVANSQNPHSSGGIGRIKSQASGGARQFATSVNKPVTRGNKEVMGSKA
jgi:hypothetical protein